MKRHLKIALDGAAKGVAVQYLATLAASICLHLGYFMPYPAFLPETVDGELQAVIWMAALSALLGAGVALAFRGVAHAGRKPVPRIRPSTRIQFRTRTQRSTMKKERRHPG